MNFLKWGKGVDTHNLLERFGKVWTPIIYDLCSLQAEAPVEVGMVLDFKASKQYPAKEVEYICKSQEDDKRQSHECRKVYKTGSSGYG